MSSRKNVKSVKKTVVTKTVTTKQQKQKNIDAEKYIFQEEEWDKSPKTDYTYSRTGSYSSIHIHQNGYISPNMSRRGLRRDVSYLELPPSVSDTQQSRTSIIVNRMNFSDSEGEDNVDSYSNRANKSESHASMSSRKSMQSNISSRRSVQSASLMNVSSSRTSNKQTSNHLQVDSAHSTNRSRRSYTPGMELRTRVLPGYLLERSGSGSSISAASIGNVSNVSVNVSNVSVRSEQQDTNLRHLYGLDGPEEMDGYFGYDDTISDESDIEVYGVNLEERESQNTVISSVTSTITTVITTISTLILYLPIKTVQLAISPFRSQEEDSLSFTQKVWLTLSTVTETLAYITLFPVYLLWSAASRAGSSFISRFRSEHESLEQESSAEHASATHTNTQASTHYNSEFTEIRSTEEETSFLYVFWSWISSPFYFLFGLMSALWWNLGGSAHGFVAKSVRSDVWLLSRTSRYRRRYGCCCLLPLLLLLPFLLAGSYYSKEHGVAFFPVFPILAANESRCCVVNQGTNITDQQIEEKVQAILMGLLADKDKEYAQLFNQNQQKLELNLEQSQSAALAAHKTDLEAMVHGILKDEFAAFALKAEGKEQEYSAAQIALQGKQDEKMSDMNAQLAAVLAKAQALEQELETAKAGIVVLKDAQTQTETLARTQAQALSEGDQEAAAAAALLMNNNIEKLEAQLGALKQDMSGIEAAQGAMLARMKDCCKNDSALAALIKGTVQSELAAIMGGGSQGGGGGWFGGGGNQGKDNVGFAAWLQSQFVQPEDMDDKLAALAAKLSKEIEARVALEKEGQSSMIYAGGAGGDLSEEQIRLMIRDALITYGADKTGQPDFALESAGGSIISTRCSETYHRRTAQLSLFGIPLWYASNSPRTVIQPDVHPGQCWAFRGTNGFLVIQLAAEIYPTGFSMEHIPKSLSPTGKIDSAPKDFSVWGLEHERDIEGRLMGNFTYQESGEPLQYFDVQQNRNEPFSILEVRIHTNHGNPEYTCLYRFRVHGNLYKP